MTKGMRSGFRPHLTGLHGRVAQCLHCQLDNIQR